MTTSRGSASREMAQCLRKLPNSFQLLETISRIIAAYNADTEPWVVGYSGGKDSTAVVKLVFQSLLRIGELHKPVTVIYCDTGVEIPAASALACQALQDLQTEARQYGLPISTRVLSPLITERFFVRIIGRGYPPPTDKFRWCTDRLRIDPVSRFLESENAKSATVVLGVRETESSTRSLTLHENATEDRFWRRQRGAADRRGLFMPIRMTSKRRVAGDLCGQTAIGTCEGRCRALRECVRRVPNSSRCQRRAMWESQIRMLDLHCCEEWGDPPEFDCQWP